MLCKKYGFDIEFDNIEKIEIFPAHEYVLEIAIEQGENTAMKLLTI